MVAVRNDIGSRDLHAIESAVVGAAPREARAGDSDLLVVPGDGLSSDAIPAARGLLELSNTSHGPVPVLSATADGIFWTALAQVRTPAHTLTMKTRAWGARFAMVSRTRASLATYGS
jgi:hypothetical protein